MAGSLNRATVIGHLGGDPEIRDVSGGSRVANFSVATTESWTAKDGEKRERTEWHRVVIWNDKLVDVVEKYVKKGDKVLIEGEMQTEKWFKRGDEETQENARYTTKIVLTGFNGRLIMLGSPGGGAARDPNDNASRPGNSSAKSGERAPVSSGSGGERGFGGGSSRLDDDIPF
ncbi:MAG: single-stranded DNA-binding protein [Sphingomonas sp.]|uniref:single-stranded DNA-binding protein n=1 Tax=Sphingomonas sp. TaxID=28214 RepID=UPI0026130211|nr:single-stranded DNA-binding protein [Sphingomonas sp.]MDK2769941.1 single-stranded DNA-binding protein [Sphingomonas sp.]